METRLSRRPKKSDAEIEADEQRVLAAQRALRQRHEEACLANVPIPTDETIQRVALECGFECPKEVIEAVEKLQVDWDAAAVGINEHTHDRAREAWRDYHAQELTKADLKDADTFTLEDFQGDFRVKMGAYKQRQKDCAAKAFDLIES